MKKMSFSHLFCEPNPKIKPISAILNIQSCCDNHTLIFNTF